MAETHKGFGLLFEMGCGKTLTAIMIAGTAYQMGKVEKVLGGSTNLRLLRMAQGLRRICRLQGKHQGTARRQEPQAEAVKRSRQLPVQGIKGSRYQLRIHMERRHL